VKQIVEEHPKTELTKPTKPPSVGFVSSNSGRSRIISASPYPRPFDPAAWRQPVTDWLHSTCLYHQRCFSGVAHLHRAYCEWELSHDDAPCNRETFQTLLLEAGFLIVEKIRGFWFGRAGQYANTLGTLAYRDHFRPSLQSVQIVGPVLHHSLPLRQVFGAVVCTPDLIAFAVGELALDYVRLEVASLIENR
jgi:hypothetical protein